ncbi:MAG: LytTR family transcriptional regulator, partial [Bacteroidia bacterium]|nr:LytTR family transcriptional regulator [Bacteroidia bacterium]
GFIKKSIFVKSGNHLEQIAFDDILYIEGMGDYRSIFCVNKRVMTLQTFYDLEKEIPETIICRVHKSYMVSINKINTIERDQVKIGNKFIPISETYKKTFLTLLKNK